MNVALCGLKEQLCLHEYRLFFFYVSQQQNIVSPLIHGVFIV